MFAEIKKNCQSLFAFLMQKILFNSLWFWQLKWVLLWLNLSNILNGVKMLVPIQYKQFIKKAVYQHHICLKTYF